MIKHPDVHPPWSEWSENQTLHVATAYSNPYRWWTRRVLMNDFRRHMAESPNVDLYVGELAYGDRPFEVTGGHANDVQLRTAHELWHKENILNVAVSRFPPAWQYGAYLDGDFHMTRRDWALETVHLLQHYDFVQLFSSYTSLSSDHRPHRIAPSFAANYMRRRRGWRPGHGKSEYSDTHGAPGGGWAFRRSALDKVGGLLDTCILGSGDMRMAYGLIQEKEVSIEMRRCGPGYTGPILAWCERARSIEKNIGCLDNHATHAFHGPYAARSYGDRWRILVENDVNIATDVSRHWQGVWRLNGNKPKLRDDIRAYFLSRNEDDPNLGPTEKHLA
jgi:hypothetical protein